MSESSSRIPKIIPANNLRELYRNLQVTSGLTGDNLNYYVKLHEEATRELENKIQLSYLPDDTFFLAGQTGSGKTTIVNYLFAKSENLAKEFSFLSIDFREETNIDDTDFHIIEILLILIKKILDISPSTLNKKHFQDKVKRIEDEQSIEYKDTAQNKWSFADFLLEGLAQVGGLGWKLDASRRETVRRKFKTKINDVANTLNELLIDFGVAEGKSLLIFLDGLEKMRNEEAIENIFNTDSLNTLKNIQTKKIISTPVHLLHRDSMANLLGNFTSIQWKIRYNPLTYKHLTKFEQKDIDTHIQQNRIVLKACILLRLADKALIDDNALEKAVEFSGGLVTDLLKILADAIVHSIGSGSTQIRLENIEKACNDYGNQKAQTFALDGQSIALLNQIHEANHLPAETQSNSKLLIRQLLFNNIISNINRVPCFFVHPLVEEAVKVYGNPTQEKT